MEEISGGGGEGRGRKECGELDVSGRQAETKTNKGRPKTVCKQAHLSIIVAQENKREREREINAKYWDVYFYCLLYKCFFLSFLFFSYFRCTVLKTILFSSG